MYANLGQTTDPWEALQQETGEYETLVSKSYSTNQLKEDNETFAIDLFDQMEPVDAAKIMLEMGIPVAFANWEIQKLMGAAYIAVTSSNCNISLRSESARVILSEALEDINSTPTLKGGNWFGRIIDKLSAGGRKLVTNPLEWIQSIGKEVGRGLRKWGDNVRRIYEIVGFGKYALDLIGLTPGFRFIFGDFLREIGVGLETGQSIDWGAVADGGATYLADMALRLKVMSHFLPPPWNLIAKVVGAIFQAGAAVIVFQRTQYKLNKIADALEEQEKARLAYEKELYGAFEEAFGTAPPPQQPSYLGSSGSNFFSGISPEAKTAILIGGIGFLGLILLKSLR